MLAGAAATGLSTALVLGQTTDTSGPPDVALAATVIGVGGRDDPTSTRLQNKLAGDFAIGVDRSNYVPIQYPANLLFQSSIDVGVPRLATAVGAADGRTRVVSYSEGTLVAEQVKRDLANSSSTATNPPPSRDDLDFVFIASPYLPNGGIFARFPGLAVPGLLPPFGPAQPTVYDSTYVTNEYDGFADFPAYFNPVSLANAVLGMVYAHPDQYYDGIKLGDLTEGQGKFTTTKPNGAGGSDTYVLVYNPHLPLLAPLRQIASLFMVTPLTEPVLSAVEPLLRVAVDMGYTDRVNANPMTPTPFSLITPPAKILAAAAAVPGAVRQGAVDAVSNAPTHTGAPTPSISTAAVAEPGLHESTGPQETSSKASTEPVGQQTSSIAGPVENVTREIRARITHPTLIAGGNISRPTTTAAPSVGGTATEAAATPESTTPATAGGDSATTGVSPAGSTTADSATGTTESPAA